LKQRLQITGLSGHGSYDPVMKAIRIMEGLSSFTKMNELNGNAADG